MKEDGMVLIIVLLIITIILALINSLAAVVGIEIRISSFSQNEIRAVYFAEAGLAAALNVIREVVREGVSITAGELEGIYGYKPDDGYKISKAFIPADLEEESVDFRLTSLGRAGGIEREITVEISLEDRARTLNAGGEIERFFTHEGRNWETVVKKDSCWEGLGAGIAIITPVDLESYVASHSEAEAVIFKSEEAGEGFVLNIKPAELEEMAAKLIYVRGDLIIQDLEGTDKHSLAGGEPPVLVLVSGDIIIEDVTAMSNLIFICLGDFEFEQPGDNINLNNIFIYAGGRVDFNRSESYYSGFEFSGKIFSRNELSILTKGGEVDQDSYTITLPAEFTILNTVNRPYITGWQE